MIYAYHEHFILALSHDEVVHGKGSLLARMPGDHWQRCANLRAYYGFMYGHPGKKLLFMGSELASYQEWNYQQSLDWHLVKDDRPDNYHLGIQRLIADLNQLYRQWPALYQQDYSAGGFSWLVVDDHQQSVFAFVRYDDSGQQPIIVISNLTPLVRHHYRLGVPRAGCYQEALNTDNPKYGGSGVANPPCSSEPQPLHQQQQSMVLDLPPLATLMLVLKD
jgi:1,4-alpha-glucan branching enzyme